MPVTGSTHQHSPRWPLSDILHCLRLKSPCLSQLGICSRYRCSRGSGPRSSGRCMVEMRSKTWSNCCWQGVLLGGGRSFLESSPGCGCLCILVICFWWFWVLSWLTAVCFIPALPGLLIETPPVLPPPLPAPAVAPSNWFSMRTPSDRSSGLSVARSWLPPSSSFLRMQTPWPCISASRGSSEPGVG